MNKKLYSANDGFKVGDLIHYGVDHMKAAKILFEKDPSLFDSGGYLAHLGIELILKAWLLEIQGEFPKTHSLAALVEKLNEKKTQIKLTAKRKKILSLIDTYGELRYPKPKRPVGIGNDDWPKIEALFCDLINRAPDQIYKYARNIDPKNKGGRVLLKKPK